jgi:hypothetical protein
MLWRCRKADEERIKPHLFFGEHDLADAVFPSANANHALVARADVTFAVRDDLIEFGPPLPPIDRIVGFRKPTRRANSVPVELDTGSGIGLKAFPAILDFGRLKGF